MTRILSAADIATVKPGKLAEAVRRECKTTLDPKALNDLRYPREYQFAAGLLASMEQVENDPACALRVRRVALALVDHGVKLEVADE